MDFVSHTNMLGVEAKEIPCIPGKGAPTVATKGAVGCLYMNTDNGDMYKCTAVNNGSYVWEPIKDKNAVSCNPQSFTAEQQAQAMENIGVEHYYHSAREAFSKPIKDITVAYTWGLYDALMDQYPNKVTKNEIHNYDGTFTNYEYVISTGRYNADGIRGTLDKETKKQKYIIMSGVHGEEKAAMMSLYRFVRDILSGHNVPPYYLESTEIHVVPCAAPYCIDACKRYNANGVNIERNFDWEWVAGTRRGEHAESEKETQAIVSWLKANQDAILFVDWHNAGNVHEVSSVVGLKDNKAVNMAKRTYFQGIDRVIPFWKDVIKYTAHEVMVGLGTSNVTVEVREPVFAYSSYVEGTAYGGVPFHYASGKLGIPSLGLETTICANADYITDELADTSKAYSAETVAVGADVIGNILLEFYRQNAIANDTSSDEDSDITIITDPDSHAGYFTITDDGVVSLKPEYRGAASKASHTAAVSDMGVGVVGSKNAELPKHLVIPEIVDGKVVYSLAQVMFHTNYAVENVTLPSTITELPTGCFANCVNLKNVYNTEGIKSIGQSAFQQTGVVRLNFQNLDQLPAPGPFSLCTQLIYADIGNVTELPNGTFDTCVKLNMVKSKNAITSAGETSFYQTANLKHANLSGLKNIGKSAFVRSAVAVDWPSLTNCQFGEYATPLQYNSTDFWSACTFTPCENRLPTFLCQKDERWADRKIGTTSKKYSSASEFFSMMHIYCALHNISISTVEEMEAVINSIDPNWLNSFSADSADMEQQIENLGMEANRFNELAKPGLLQSMYNALMDGNYAIINYDEPLVGGHSVVIYGINAKGELLVADSEVGNFADGKREAKKYALPISKLKSQLNPDDNYCLHIVYLE